MGSGGKNRKNKVIWVNKDTNVTETCSAISESTKYSPNCPNEPDADYDKKLAEHGVKVARKIAACLGLSAESR